MDSSYRKIVFFLASIFLCSHTLTIEPIYARGCPLPDRYRFKIDPSTVSQKEIDLLNQLKNICPSETQLAEQYVRIIVGLVYQKRHQEAKKALGILSKDLKNEVFKSDYRICTYFTWGFNYILYSSQVGKLEPEVSEFVQDVERYTPIGIDSEDTLNSLKYKTIPEPLQVSKVLDVLYEEKKQKHSKTWTSQTEKTVGIRDLIVLAENQKRFQDALKFTRQFAENLESRGIKSSGSDLHVTKYLLLNDDIDFPEAYRRVLQNKQYSYQKGSYAISYFAEACVDAGQLEKAESMFRFGIKKFGYNWSFYHNILRELLKKFEASHQSKKAYRLLRFYIDQLPEDVSRPHLEEQLANIKKKAGEENEAHLKIEN